MTYRASLGTRGELRRIAAEAESITIDRVRPWIRKVQHCRLAPHVIVPQWIRLEHPVKPKPPPRLVSEARIVAGELVEEILDSVTAKKFRRGRGRRGRPRKRPEAALNPDPGSAETEGTGGVEVAAPVPTSENAPMDVEPVTVSAKDTQGDSAPAEPQKVEMKSLQTGEPTEKDNEPPKADQSKDEDDTKPQPKAEEGTNVEAESQIEQTVGGEKLEEKDLITLDENELAAGQDVNMEVNPMAGEKIAEGGNIDKDETMTDAPPVSKEVTS